jgi:hypothetical protein
MQDVLPILTELRHALDMQMELETFVEKENYFQVNLVLLLLFYLTSSLVDFFNLG